MLRLRPVRPLSIRPHHGSGLAPATRPDRLPATYRRRHGIRYFHGCYSLGDDQLWDVLRRRKGGDHTLAALRSIRAVRPDGAPIYVIMDNLSANTTPAVHAWAGKNKVQLCLTPTYYSWANPIEAQFGPLRTFMANSNYPNHTVRLVISRHICAGATPTPATPTSPPNAANAPESAAREATAVADLEPHDQNRRTYVVTALAAEPGRR